MRVSRFVTLAAVLGITASAPVAASAATSPARPHDLFGVSCLSPTNCVAVGSIDNGKAGNGASTLAEIWNGKNWQTVPVKLPVSGAFDDSLASVSCAPAAGRAAGRCVAVGGYATLNTTPALAETWNGKAWAPTTPTAPAGSLEVNLDGVSCVSAAHCVAVGAYGPKTGAFAPVAESWNGARWVPATPPAVKDSVISELNSVSCVSAARCVAVGFYATFNGGSVLIESLSGKAWTRMNVPLPAGTRDSALTGVSCASASSCVAVGNAEGSRPGLVAFSELWNGRTWRVASIAWPRGTGNSDLTSVSCAAPTRCFAAGYTGFDINSAENTGRATAVSWNGKAWTVTRVPAPPKGKASLFHAVSCLSAADCVAAGQEGPFGTIQGNGLTGFWNGKGWKLVAAS